MPIIINVSFFISNLKYFLIVFFFLVFCAYVGQSVDNFLLTYLASNYSMIFLNNYYRVIKALIFTLSKKALISVLTPGIISLGVNISK
jgi:hypothetical protein